MEWTIDRLLEYTVQEGECLKWTRCFNSDGYARLAPNVKVHRLMCQLYTGEDIGGKQVMHTCDNTWCINPEHLKIGNHLLNNRDRMLKDRSYRTVKREHVEKVMALKDELTKTEIARYLGMDLRRVGEIISGVRGEDGRVISGRRPQGGVLFVD